VSKPVIGRVERIELVDAGIKNLPAKVDTGAYRSSIWATKIREKNGKLYFTLLGPRSPLYNGQELSTEEYKLVEVENSFGDKQCRYSIFLTVRVGGKLIKSNFTLANRSMKTYPALIGRKLLKNRFVVDVASGDPIEDEEKNGDESLE
jgi:hypothetical protein